MAWSIPVRPYVAPPGSVEGRKKCRGASWTRPRVNLLPSFGLTVKPEGRIARSGEGGTNYTALRILSSEAHFSARTSHQLGFRSFVRAMTSRSRSRLCAIKSESSNALFISAPDSRPPIVSSASRSPAFWRHWRSTLLVVKPETVVAWHRNGFRIFLELESRAQTTRTARRSSARLEPDPQDMQGEPHLGCTSDSRGVAQARHRHRRE
jgi:hypothetical protein